jgi:hypothetical protein
MVYLAQFCHLYLQVFLAFCNERNKAFFCQQNFSGDKNTAWKDIPGRAFVRNTALFSLPKKASMICLE